MVKGRLKLFLGTAVSVLMSSVMLFTATPDVVYAGTTGWVGRERNTILV